MSSSYEIVVLNGKRQYSIIPRILLHRNTRHCNVEKFFVNTSPLLIYTWKSCEVLLALDCRIVTAAGQGNAPPSIVMTCPVI